MESLWRRGVGAGMSKKIPPFINKNHPKKHVVSFAFSASIYFV